MSRPEHQAPPEIFYNEEAAAKYSTNSHVQDVQARLTDRALELLLLPEDQGCLLLDIGCGSGLSGECLTEAGHGWIGVDISQAMLDVAVEREVDGDLLLGDIGQRRVFFLGDAQCTQRYGFALGASMEQLAVQWLCNADRKEHEPYRRLLCFFKWLYAALNRGARAALQFYPENPEQIEMITSAALRSGFGGGLVVDFPNSTRAKKHFLVIWAGISGTAAPKLPQGLTGDDANDAEDHVNVSRRSKHESKRKRHNAVKDRNWVLNKKEAQRHLGRVVRPDTKYTGRKRKDKF